jgi:hypothetical protein
MTWDLAPVADAGTVTIDARRRALIVRPAARADGYSKLLWDDGIGALAKPEARTVWASGAGKSEISFGQPTDDGALEFTFAVGDPTYKKLVSTPGLRATFGVDTVSRRILSVTFRGR